MQVIFLIGRLLVDISPTWRLTYAIPSLNLLAASHLVACPRPAFLHMAKIDDRKMCGQMYNSYQVITPDVQAGYAQCVSTYVATLVLSEESRTC